MKYGRTYCLTIDRSRVVRTGDATNCPPWWFFFENFIDIVKHLCLIECYSYSYFQFSSSNKVFQIKKNCFFFFFRSISISYLCIVKNQWGERIYSRRNQCVVFFVSLDFRSINWSNEIPCMPSIDREFSLFCFVSLLDMSFFHLFSFKNSSIEWISYQNHRKINLILVVNYFNWMIDFYFHM
jgi:hypothetical protein